MNVLKPWKCVICGVRCTGYGHNPAPVSDFGRCCESCNAMNVIPTRIKLLFNREKKSD